MLVLGQILKIRGHWYPPLRYGNNLCTSDKSKAEALSYFYSVFTQEKLPIPTKLEICPEMHALAKMAEIAKFAKL